MRYRKKAVVIEAFQYDGDLKGRDGKYYVPDWAVEAYEKGIMHYKTVKFHEPPELFIDTLEGTHHVSVGDYVIRGVKGELYPCKPDIFKETYEKAGEKEKKIDSWIPVSERLPEDEKEYLVTLEKTVGIPETMMSIARYLNFSDIGYWCDVVYGYLGWDRYNRGRVGTMQYKVTAWMPLPEPYREEKDE